MKSGVLRKTTRIYSMSGLVLTVRAGTSVIVDRGVLTFNPIEGVRVTKLQGSYLADLWGVVHILVFPKGGRTPYPLSML